jgi:hypothetical protein
VHALDADIAAVDLSLIWGVPSTACMHAATRTGRAAGGRVRGGARVRRDALLQQGLACGVAAHRRRRRVLELVRLRAPHAAHENQPSRNAPEVPRLFTSYTSSEQGLTRIHAIDMRAHTIEMRLLQCMP